MMRVDNRTKGVCEIWRLQTSVLLEHGPSNIHCEGLTLMETPSNILVQMARRVLSVLILSSWVSGVLATGIVGGAFAYLQEAQTNTATIRDFSNELKSAKVSYEPRIQKAIKQQQLDTNSFFAGMLAQFALVPVFVATVESLTMIKAASAVALWALYLLALLRHFGVSRPFWQFTMPLAGGCVWLFFPIFIGAVQLVAIEIPQAPWLPGAGVVFRLGGAFAVGRFLAKNASLPMSFSVPAIALPAMSGWMSYSALVDISLR